MSSKRTIVITGADGFIGRHLVARLRTGELNNVVEITLGAGFDLSRPGWTGRIQCECADVVVHLAQSLRYREFPGGSWDMFMVNVAATAELLEWARAHSVKRFLLASSGSVYAPACSLLDEEAPCRPGSMYAATKLSAEYIAMQYGRLFQVLIVRPFTVYGPGQRGMLIADMIVRVREGRDIELARGVGVYLTPLFVGDCVGALECLIDASLEDRAAVLNLAGSEILSLGEIVEEISRQTGRAAAIRRTDAQPVYLCGDNRRLRQYWSRFTPFSEGLRLTLEASA